MMIMYTATVNLSISVNLEPKFTTKRAQDRFVEGDDEKREKQIVKEFTDYLNSCLQQKKNEWAIMKFNMLRQGMQGTDKKKTIRKDGLFGIPDITCGILLPDVTLCDLVENFTRQAIDSKNRPPQSCAAGQILHCPIWYKPEKTNKKTKPDLTLQIWFQGF